MCFFAKTKTYINMNTFLMFCIIVLIIVCTQIGKYLYNKGNTVYYLYTLKSAGGFTLTNRDFTINPTIRYEITEVIEVPKFDMKFHGYTSDLDYIKFFISRRYVDCSIVSIIQISKKKYFDFLEQQKANGQVFEDGFMG